MVIESNNAKAVNLDKLQFVGMLLGVIGLIIALIPIFGATGDARASALQSYVFGYAFWFTVTIGCLGLTFLHHVVRGAWGLSILRLIEAGGGAVMLVVFAILLAPVFMNMTSVYHWADPAYMETADALKRKAFYLNQNGFFIRVAIYFLIWIAYAAFFRASSLKQDQNMEVAEQQKRTTWAAPGLVIYFLTVTGATVDLFMSLDAHWMSQIWGFLFIVMGALSTMAICNMIVMSNAGKAPFLAIMNRGLSKDLGNWLFVFTCLWAYFAFSQYVIIYAGNLPEFNSFFVARRGEGWGMMSMVLLFGSFLVPFLTLLSPKVKATPGMLVQIAVFIFVLRVIDMYWIIMPFFRKEFAPTIYDLVAFVGIGGAWLAVFGSQLQKGALIPTHDPRVLTAYEHA